MLTTRPSTTKSTISWIGMATPMLRVDCGLPTPPEPHYTQGRCVPLDGCRSLDVDHLATGESREVGGWEAEDSVGGTGGGPDFAEGEQVGVDVERQVFTVANRGDAAELVHRVGDGDEVL